MFKYLNIIISSMILFYVNIINALTPQECLKELQDINNENISITFTGRDKVYCAYSPRDDISELRFSINNAKINDWDIMVGEWDKVNSIFNIIQQPQIIPYINKFKIDIENGNINSAVFILRSDNKNGSISNVTVSKKELEKRSTTDGNGTNVFSLHSIDTWETISWSNSFEIGVESEQILVNNTNYLDTFGLYYSDSGFYYTDTYSIGFYIYADTSDWVVYSGYYDSKKGKVTICYSWDLSSIPETKDSINMNTYTLTKLSTDSPTKKYSNIGKMNMIWWQNINSSENSQRIKISLKGS